MNWHWPKVYFNDGDIHYWIVCTKKIYIINTHVPLTHLPCALCNNKHQIHEDNANWQSTVWLNGLDHNCLPHVQIWIEQDINSLKQKGRRRRWWGSVGVQKFILLYMPVWSFSSSEIRATRNGKGPIDFNDKDPCQRQGLTVQANNQLYMSFVKINAVVIWSSLVKT